MAALLGLVSQGTDDVTQGKLQIESGKEGVTLIAADIEAARE